MVQFQLMKILFLIFILTFSSQAMTQSKFNWRSEVFSKPHFLTYDQKTGNNKANGSSYVAQDVILGLHYKFPVVISETNVEIFSLGIDTYSESKNLLLTAVEQSFSYKNLFASAQYDQLPLADFSATETSIERIDVIWTNLGFRVLVSKKLRLKSKFYLGYPVSVNAPESASKVTGLRAYGDITWRKRIKRRWDLYINYFVDSKKIDFISQEVKTNFFLFRTGAGVGISYLL